MKVIIAGSRDIPSRKAQDAVQDCIARSGWRDLITEIVHGGCRGIDRAAHDVAEGLWPIKVFPADWNLYGRAAGPIRNGQMADYADALIAIKLEGAANRGTENMIEAMRNRDKDVLIFTVSLEQ